jgi:hypothetical protein
VDLRPFAAPPDVFLLRTLAHLVTSYCKITWPDTIVSSNTQGRELAAGTNANCWWDRGMPSVKLLLLAWTVYHLKLGSRHPLALASRLLRMSDLVLLKGVRFSMNDAAAAAMWCGSGISN